jgi:hypothetical protein
VTDEKDPADQPMYEQLGDKGNPFTTGGPGAPEEPGGDIETEVASESDHEVTESDHEVTETEHHV